MQATTKRGKTSSFTCPHGPEDRRCGRRTQASRTNKSLRQFSGTRRASRGARPCQGNAPLCQSSTRRTRRRRATTRRRRPISNGVTTLMMSEGVPSLGLARCYGKKQGISRARSEERRGGMLCTKPPLCWGCAMAMFDALKLGASSNWSSSGVFQKSCSLMRTRVIDSGLPLLHACAHARN